jgi:hypothetical protein
MTSTPLWMDVVAVDSVPGTVAASSFELLTLSLLLSPESSSMCFQKTDDLHLITLTFGKPQFCHGERSCCPDVTELATVSKLWC